MAKIEDILVFLRPYPTQSQRTRAALPTLYIHTQTSKSLRSTLVVQERSTRTSAALSVPASAPVVVVLYLHVKTGSHSWFQSLVYGFSHWFMVSVTGLWFQTPVPLTGDRFHSRLSANLTASPEPGPESAGSEPCTRRRRHGNVHAGSTESTAARTRES